MSPRERELSELLGAYALDAVSDEERVEIDDYLARSPRARAEVAEHLEVAALLGGAAGEAPAGIWDLIDASLDDAASFGTTPFETSSLETSSLETSSLETSSLDAAPLQTTKAGLAPTAVVLPFADRSARRGARRWTASLFASAAAAAVVLGLGISNVRQDRLIKDYKSELAASRDGALRLNELLASPGTKVATLRNDGGQPIARVVLATSGEGYLIDSGLPHLSSGRTYQLWGVNNGTVLSLGVMGDSDRPIPLAARGSWSKLVLTEETSPGVVSSAQPALAAGLLST